MAVKSIAVFAKPWNQGETAIQSCDKPRAILRHFFLYFVPKWADVEVTAAFCSDVHVLQKQR